MSTAAQDFITEAKLPIKFNILHFEFLQKDNEKICSVYFGKDFGSQEKKEEVGHFIAAAINEKIEREKGEREDGFLKALDESISIAEIVVKISVGLSNEQHTKGYLAALNSVRDLYLSTPRITAKEKPLNTHNP